ncbi:helix-turn-helix domain-containing protein [Streptomyces sp. NPDC051561]|uniref:helix-turn-helix domain-containing protein n=1 Tax=Streptomyces sp. NPDC051561 TaxID=3365658 RepID=UPI003798E04B
MPAKPTATGRRMRVASELRSMRERAGLTTTEVGRLLGVGQGQFSNIETGRFGVSAERLRVLAATYGCTDQPFVDALTVMAEDRTRGWWSEYRDILPPAFLDLAELEHHGMSLRTATTAHVPGLLQTFEHAQEIVRTAVPRLDSSEVEHRVSFRIKRQAVLYGDTPRPYQALVHEAALRIQVGGPKTARAQLHHLLEMSEHGHVTIRAIPFSAGAFPGSGQSIYYAHGPVPQLDTVQLDQSHGVGFVFTRPELLAYRALFDEIEAIALTPERTRDLIRSIHKLT